jgi:anti-sigma B factor antagonist
MNVEIEQMDSGEVVVYPQGKLDARTALAFKEQLRKIADDHPAVVIVDLAQVAFIDSSGLSALVSGMKAIRQNGGMLNLSSPRQQALTALRLTLLDRVFPIFPNLEDALEEGDLLSP